MGWTIEIEHSQGTFELESNFAWEWDLARQVNSKGVVEYIDLYVKVRGQVVGATPGDVADDTVAQYELAALRLQPVSITFKLDGVEKFSWTPATSVIPPSILNWGTEEGDGAGGSRWVYRLDLFVRLPGNNWAGLHELRTTLTVSKNQSGRVVSKLWQAVGKAQTITRAEAGVRRFKPSGKVSEVVQRMFDPEPTCSISWLWQPTTRTHMEVITIMGGKPTWEVDPQAGVNVRPLLHLARLGAQVVRLDGRIRDLETVNIVAPAPHWKESSSLKRQWGHEPQSKPTTQDEDDAQQGLRTFTYSEIYVNTGATLPEPNHGGHAGTATVEKEPADGAIAR
jgi:hypothetical protein